MSNPLLLVALFIGILLFFLAIGYPVGFGLGFTSVLLMLLGVGPGLNAALMVSRMYRGINSFVLLSIPFFLFAGRIMNEAGMTEHIFGFCKAIIGPVRGAVGHVNVLASMIFAGMSGIALGDMAGLGPIEYRAMIADDYPSDFSVGITAASSLIGPIIPPSVPLVVYALLADVSVGAILLGGLLPGVLIGLSLMVMISIISKKRGLPKGEKRSWKVIKESFKESFLALLTPVILLGGIVTGVFTITEAAAVTVVYALIISLFVYKSLSWSRLWQISKECMVDSAVICFLMTTASVYGFLVTHSRLPAILADGLLSITTNRVVILLLLNVFLIIVGFFLESITAITILVPVFLPILDSVGIGRMHFGVVMVFNLMIGLLTPPYGEGLFVLSKAIGLTIEDVIDGCKPFYPMLFLALLFITFVPQVVELIPTMVFK